MSIEELKNKDYLSAQDLMQIIPNLTYDNAIKYINDARKEMEKQHLYIPITRPKLALTKIIRKRFGF